MSNFISNKFCKSNRNFFESKREINGQIKWGALQHWGAWQTTLHREDEERDREHELDHAPYNKKAELEYLSKVLYDMHTYILINDFIALILLTMWFIIYCCMKVIW